MQDVEVIPFVDGTSQAIARILSKLNIKTVQRPQSWKWKVQHSLKDITNAQHELGVVYELSCHDCDRTYVGETGRVLSKRIAEHEAGV